MTTTPLIKPVTGVATCPPWCSLTPGHPWDSIEMREGVFCRSHQGPTFGDHVSICSMEYDDAPGVVQELIVSVSTEVERDTITPAAARDLAQNLLDAAEWFEVDW